MPNEKNIPLMRRIETSPIKLKHVHPPRAMRNPPNSPTAIPLPHQTNIRPNSNCNQRSKTHQLKRQKSPQPIQKRRPKTTLLNIHPVKNIMKRNDSPQTKNPTEKRQSKPNKIRQPRPPKNSHMNIKMNQMRTQPQNPKQQQNQRKNRIRPPNPMHHDLAVLKRNFAALNLIRKYMNLFYTLKTRQLPQQIISIFTKPTPRRRETRNETNVNSHSKSSSNSNSKSELLGLKSKVNKKFTNTK